MQKTLIIIIALIFISCITDNKPKIVHQKEQGEQVLKPIKDSTFIEIADLPIEIDSTDYLIHPVGNFKIEDSRGKVIYKSSNYRSQNFSISSYNGYTLSGNLTNVLFQNKNTHELIPLSKDYIKIVSMTFLRKVSDKIKKQYWVYKVLDNDTNLDGILDYEDVNTFYISKIDGSGFKKISEENRELINWKLIESTNKLYFRTVEDKNRDGDFDNTDTVHYRYIDLSADDLEVMEYNPL